MPSCPDYGALARLAPELRHAYVQAFTEALNTTFLVTAAVALIGFVLSWLLRELPLRKTVAAATADDVGNSAGHALAMPSDPDSMSLLVRSLVRLADRDVQRRYIAAVVARAGVDLEPLEAWLLVRIEENSMLRLSDLSRDYNIEQSRLQAALERLTSRELVQAAPANGSAQSYKITAAGCSVFSSLIKARRDHLAEMSSDWSDQEREKITELVAELARRLVPEMREDART